MCVCFEALSLLILTDPDCSIALKATLLLHHIIITVVVLFCGLWSNWHYIFDIYPFDISECVSFLLSDFDYCTQGSEMLPPSWAEQLLSMPFLVETMCNIRSTRSHASSDLRITDGLHAHSPDLRFR